MPNLFIAVGRSLQDAPGSTRCPHPAYDINPIKSTSRTPWSTKNTTRSGFSLMAPLDWEMGPLGNSIGGSPPLQHVLPAEYFQKSAGTPLQSVSAWRKSTTLKFFFYDCHLMAQARALLSRPNVAKRLQDSYFTSLIVILYTSTIMTIDSTVNQLSSVPHRSKWWGGGRGPGGGIELVGAQLGTFGLRFSFFYRPSQFW